MKILRVRRGFTTNSSASSEWVPPQWTPGAKLPPPPGSAPGTSGTSPSGTPIAPMTSLSAEPAPPPTTPNSNLTTIGLGFGGLLGLFAVAFALERLGRRVLGTKKYAEVDDD